MANLEWNSRGLLDPISEPLAMDRAPYKLTPDAVVMRFATTEERRRILRGWLSYRAELASIGIAQGFQWIDGSFMEDIETLEARPPGDIDVVTFYDLPPGQTQATLFAARPELFPVEEDEKAILRQQFGVDGVMSCLKASQRQLIRQLVFFYSLMSHRRDQTWKGFVQVELGDAAFDQAANDLIQQMG
jgi:hypothetical protein